MPDHLLWTDAERLRHAFRQRHGVNDDAAGLALSTIVSTHDQAARLRKTARVMRPEMAEKVSGTADRLDAAAREIFYDPAQQRPLRPILARADLIEDAALAHARLRGRKQEEAEDQSRIQLASAIASLDAALEQNDLIAARGLLQEVEVASSVAEQLLRPANHKA